MDGLSINDDLRYLADIQSQEDEIRRLNDELDSKICAVNTIESSRKNNHQAESNVKLQTKEFDTINRKTTANNFPAATKYDRWKDKKIDKYVPVKSPRIIPEQSTVEKDSDQKIRIQRVLPSSDVTQNQIDDDNNSIEEYGLNVPGQEDIGQGALIRLLKSRIKALTKNLKDALSQKNDMENKLSSYQSKMKEALGEKQKLQKSLVGTKTLSDKRQNEASESKQGLVAIKQELNDTRIKLVEAQKIAKKTDSEHKARQIRLTRALEECERYKATLGKATSETRECGASARQANDKLHSQVKSLERQRSELIIAFRKQCKLIDILKRQKLHAEAAKLLNFTEEEFMKVLDWGTERQ